MSVSPIRITDALRGRVVASVQNVYSWFIDEVNREKPALGDRIYELAYAPYLVTMQTLPKELFRTTTSIEVKVREGYFTTFDLSSERLIGYDHPHQGPVVDARDGDRFEIRRTPETAEIYDALYDWVRRKDEIIARRGRMEKAVAGVMDKFKSLAPVIKDFPPIVDLLPPDVRKKVAVPQHRLSSVSMELNPDLKQLAADIAYRKVMMRSGA